MHKAIKSKDLIRDRSRILLPASLVNSATWAEKKYSAVSEPHINSKRHGSLTVGVELVAKLPRRARSGVGEIKTKVHQCI